MKRTYSHFLIVGMVVTAYLLGGFAPLERGLSSLRYRLLARPASGAIVVVGIDTRSLKALNVWPWPREYHAQLIDRLVRANTRRIALDIDFSSISSPESDAAFEAALARAGDRVILATFKQLVRDAQGNEDFVYTAPIPRLARHARLGHVNVQVEDDSLVWRYATFERIGQVRLPGMATLLADAETADDAFFTIDYSIQAETLPYVSYIDVLTGKFDPAIFAGRTVIVGATALELGDRIPVPVEYVLPGPIVQALVADTIVQGRGLAPVNRWVIAALAVLAGAFFALCVARLSWKWGAAAVAGFGTAMFAASVGLEALTPSYLEMTPIVLAPLGLFLLNLTRSIDSLGSMFRRERMESLYRRAMMGAVVDSSFDGIVITGRDGKVELANPSAGRILGDDEETFRGLDVQSVLPWSQEIEALYETDEDGGQKATVVGPLELTFSRDGADITVEMIASSSRLTLNRASKDEEKDERVVYIYMFRDITDRKRVEEAQRLATEEANAANRAKTEFLHNMSHELRTPLNAIIGFSDIIKNEMMGPVGVVQYLEYIRDINNSGQHLLQVVNDILDMSKIESGQMELQVNEVYIPHTVEASRRLVEERARTAGLTLAIDLPADLPELTCDERMVKQMLLNLLTNAIKFTPEGGTVTVGGAASDDGSVAIWVRDTGIGIDAKDFDRVMEPFGQADASLSRGYEGTGLGLPLVKSMIEMHDGTFELESAVGVGTTVSLRFPPARGVAARPARRPAAVA